MNNKRILYIISIILLYTSITLVNLGNIIQFDKMLGVFNGTGNFSFLLVLLPLAFVLLVVSLVICLIFRKKFQPVKKSLTLTILLILGIVLTEIISLLYGLEIVSVYLYIVINLLTVAIIVLYVLQKYLNKAQHVNK